MADMSPDGVIDLLDQLREAGATIMPEVWHYITAAQIVPGIIVPPDQAPSPRGPRGDWEDQGCAPSARHIIKFFLKRLSRASAIGRLL